MDESLNDASLLLRLPTDIQSELARQATLHARPVSAEISIRLRDSLRRDLAAVPPVLLDFTPPPLPSPRRSGADRRQAR